MSFHAYALDVKIRYATALMHIMHLMHIDVKYTVDMPHMM